MATKDIYAADEEPESESPSSPSVSDDVRSHPLFQDLMFTDCMLEDAKADLVMLGDEIRDVADDHATDEASAHSSPAHVAVPADVESANPHAVEKDSAVCAFSIIILPREVLKPAVDACQVLTWAEQMENCCGKKGSIILVDSEDETTRVSLENDVTAWFPSAAVASIPTSVPANSRSRQYIEHVVLIVTSSLNPNQTSPAPRGASKSSCSP